MVALYMVLVDFQKLLDSNEVLTVFEFIENKRIGSRNINIIYFHHSYKDGRKRTP